MKRFRVSDLPHGEFVYLAHKEKCIVSMFSNVRNSGVQLYSLIVSVNRQSNNRRMSLLRWSEDRDTITVPSTTTTLSQNRTLCIPLICKYEWNKLPFLLTSNKKYTWWSALHSEGLLNPKVQLHLILFFIKSHLVIHPVQFCRFTCHNCLHLAERSLNSMLGKMTIFLS